MNNNYNSPKPAWAALVVLAALLAGPISGAWSQPYALIKPRVNESLLLDIVVAGERLITVGERGHIMYSDDAGESWVQAAVPTRQMLTAVYFPSPQRGWAVGHDGLILASVDAGEHWVIQRNGLEQQARINQALLRSALARREQLNKALTATEAEGGAHTAPAAGVQNLQQQWQAVQLDIEDAEYALAQPVNAPPLLDVYFVDSLRGFAVGAFNTLLRTDDGGLNWQSAAAEVDNPDELHLNAITGNGNGLLWIAGEGGILYRSDDAGNTWQTLAGPYAGTWFGVAAVPGENTVLIFGLRGNVWRSVDGGESWLRAQLETERSLAGGHFLNRDYVVLVGSVGALWVSEDGGRSFTDRTLPSRRNLSAVSCTRDGAVVVGQGGVQAIDCFGAAHE